MNHRGSLELRVGILFISVLIMVGSLSLLISTGPSFTGGSKTYWFEFEDAYGLQEGSPVSVAGIVVGSVNKIELKKNKARLFIKVKKQIPITSSSYIKIRPTGILGDKNISLFLGDEQGQLLKDKEQITKVLTNPDMANIAELLSESILVIKDIALSFKKTFEIQTIDDESTVIEKILGETKDMISSLSHVSQENIDKISRIINRLDQITERFTDFVEEGGIEHLESSIRNIALVTEKIEEGQGSLGSLINDDTTITQLNQTVSSINNYLGNISKIETGFDFHTEYLEKSKTFKSFFGLKIIPGLDRHYEINLISDSKGVAKETVTKTSSPGSNLTQVREEEKLYKNQLRLSALFVKNFYDFSLKLGVIENSAGFGLDAYLLNKKFKLSTEFFGMEDFKMRAFLKFNLFQGFYLIGGSNYLFSNEKTASPFFGAGLFMTNEDIKTLASRVSF